MLLSLVGCDRSAWHNIFAAVSEPQEVERMPLTPTGQEPDARACPGHILFSSIDPQNALVWVLVSHEALHGKLDNHAKPQHELARLEIFRLHQGRIEAAASKKFEAKGLEYIEGLGPTVILQSADL